MTLPPPSQKHKYAPPPGIINSHTTRPPAPAPATVVPSSVHSVVWVAPASSMIMGCLCNFIIQSSGRIKEGQRWQKSSRSNLLSWSKKVRHCWGFRPSHRHKSHCEWKGDFGVGDDVDGKYHELWISWLVTVLMLEMVEMVTHMQTAGKESPSPGVARRYVPAMSSSPALQYNYMWNRLMAKIVLEDFAHQWPPSQRSSPPGHGHGGLQGEEGEPPAGQEDQEYSLPWSNSTSECVQFRGTREQELRSTGGDSIKPDWLTCYSCVKFF